ncbi:hypothetical protein [Streptomyces phytohabitans]|uniref:hypothetical protein n=1 Tax=Streptomyces phytohabitans TaxID=1150371 RepID=UPI00345BFCFA
MRVTDADLDDAGLRDVDLHRADLRDGKGLRVSMVTSALVDETTRLSSDLAFDPDVIARIAEVVEERAVT